MAYGVEQDRLRAILRINAEIENEKSGYVEFNTAVEKTIVVSFLRDVPAAASRSYCTSKKIPD